MREIKFRAWDEDGYMFTPMTLDLSKLDGFPMTLQNGSITGTHGDAVTLMQYTNLKDKNDKEIYEGDVLENRETSSDGSHVFSRKSVIWIKDYGQYNISGTRTNRWEVIGNIYESPELLK